MRSRSIVKCVVGKRSSLAGILVLAALSAGCWLAPAALAKDNPLIAIELYDAPTGAAYLQLTDVEINGKEEMKDCTPYQDVTIDKSSYGKMGKVILAPGGTLERGSDGVMRYTSSLGQSYCVVPGNARFDRGAVTLSTMADDTLLHGTPIGGSNGNPLFTPPIHKGVKLIFVSAPNQEMAEFLRAQRASDMDGWLGYLSKYPAGPHAAEARRDLAAQYLSAGEASLQAYDRSLTAGSPAYSNLKSAKAKADKAHTLAPDLAATAQLNQEIRGRISAIAELGRGELGAYRTALASHTAGLIHLQNARSYSDSVADVDPFFAPGQTLANDILQENNTFETAMMSAESYLTTGQFDQAYSLVQPYRAFSAEETHIVHVVDAAYGHHLELGNKLEQSEDWTGAIQEFEKAGSIKDTAEVQESVKNAQKQMAAAQDKSVVDKALESSKQFQAQHNMLRAYDVLASLPDAQLAQVAEQMKALEPAYVQSAALEAKALHQAHSPIRGLADEVAIEKAYQFLQKAYDLSENEAYKDKRDLDGNELSAYLLDQAKHYLAKPGGSGTELGWSCLEKARQYKASNLDAVRDALVAAAPAHAMRSKLSIRVQFRDQTSQRDSQGVAGQLENAIITGLESSGVPVKVVRTGETTAVEPDFELDGDVLDHHLSVVPTIEPLDSEYRSGEEQIPSTAWNTANRAYETAQDDLKTAQAELEGAEARGKSAQIKSLSDAVKAAERRVQDAREAVDSTSKTVTRDIIRPYTYQKKIINITGAIQLQFRIVDSLSEHRTELVPITREEHKKDILLVDVKPEDTKGVKSSGTITDPAEFMTALENSAREELIAAVRKKVEELPIKIYQSANSREKEDDLDGAGEEYLRYLNLTHENDSVERTHAKQFLAVSFNMTPVSSDTQ